MRSPAPLRFPANDPGSGFGLANGTRSCGLLLRARASPPPLPHPPRLGSPPAGAAGPGWGASWPLSRSPKCQGHPGTELTLGAPTSSRFCALPPTPVPSTGIFDVTFSPLLFVQEPGTPRFLRCSGGAPVVAGRYFSRSHAPVPG